MDQFCKGLMTLGIHSAVQVCPKLMQKYFIAQPIQLTALHIMDLFANLNVLQEDKVGKSSWVFGRMHSYS